MFKCTSENPTIVGLYKENFIEFVEWKYCNVLKKSKTIHDIVSIQFAVQSAPGFPAGKKKDLKATIPFMEGDAKNYFMNFCLRIVDKMLCFNFRQN